MDLVTAIKTVDVVIRVAAPILEAVTVKLAPEMKQFADRLYKLSEKYPQLEEWAQAIEKGAEILTDILFALGIECDSADKLGFKANQSCKNIGEFDTVEAYIKYLHDEVELDKEKFESLSDEEKMAYRTTGMAVEAAAIGEKLGVEISPDFVMFISKLQAVGDIALEIADLVSVLKNIKENGINNSNDVLEYFSGKGDSDRIHTGEVIRTKFEELYGEKASDIIETIKMQQRPE